ncbi:MAG: hypothetical protein IT293_14985 [Deltaproteobacteria bacterium]|nr:hypothetical protein [Deltaproteobacteria bacterium]
MGAARSEQRGERDGTASALDVSPEADRRIGEVGSPYGAPPRAALETPGTASFPTAGQRRFEATPISGQSAPEEAGAFDSDGIDTLRELGNGGIERAVAAVVRKAGGVSEVDAVQTQQLAGARVLEDEHAVALARMAPRDACRDRAVIVEREAEVGPAAVGRLLVPEPAGVEHLGEGNRRRVAAPKDPAGESPRVLGERGARRDARGLCVIAARVAAGMDTSAPCDGAKASAEPRQPRRDRACARSGDGARAEVEPCERFGADRSHDRATRGERDQERQRDRHTAARGEKGDAGGQHGNEGREHLPCRARPRRPARRAVRAPGAEGPR